ncbi:hypothetical protein BC940DRAFT_131237 [Gongronella butleri]|nr:hypothetical protein BC940DRAFT_131237 [Gongronella butleri]
MQSKEVERRKKQNRIAQMNFRIRKEMYVKELEAKVRDMELLKERVDALEKENARLKYRLWEVENGNGIGNGHALSSSPTASPSAHHTSNSHGASSSSIPPTNTTSGYSRQYAPYDSSNSLPPLPRPLHADHQHHPAVASHHHHPANASNAPHTHNAYTSPTLSASSQPVSTPNNEASPASTPSSLPTTPSLGSPGRTVGPSLPILPPPPTSSSNSSSTSSSAAAASSVFRPIPIAHWDKESNQRQTRRGSSDTPSDHGRVLDDLASILRTRHRPPLRQPEQTTNG